MLILGVPFSPVSRHALSIWQDQIRCLSNEERDQTDLQARVILSRCAGRVKEIEALEKRTLQPHSKYHLLVLISDQQGELR